MNSIQSPPSHQPPETIALSTKEWLQKNLFNTWYNILITIGIGSLLLSMLTGFISWAFTTAKWAVIPANLPLYFVGRFPSDQYWRLWIMLGMIAIFSGITWGFLARNTRILFSKNILIGISLIGILAVITPTPIVFRLLLIVMLLLLVAGAWGGKTIGNTQPKLGEWLPFSWFLLLLICVWLIGGGLGLKVVETNLWGGLMLTLLMSIISILLCFPIGILLALGRQSSLPVIRILSTVYIEVIRGLPLITILFMGQILLPLFLPEGARPDRILRAIIGLTMFSSAYLAENIRGGLQGIPRGQTEAAKALGLNTPLTVSLIVLPQALKVAIPSIVGQFISLFQDTTLLSIVGLMELLGMSRSILANPKFLGRHLEVYIFVGILYWVFCYGMSIASQKLEQQLNTEHK
ncbi:MULTISPECIES: amino acid ABC transporter permease [Planktothrix]|uniref:Amino acid ABC transporter, permease protein, 3-TM region,His/Glu/Gln/Arg/opine n=1 Tax=Planktothrix rubescens CCAP 1459/22 TaxID=329571 RepID=A0A6J7ZLC5_PLARU|nr:MULTISPECIES: amino acid ABC transporter permease [Planktothrix]CAC5342728.1 Amino acid ABC transporter, permease protein, 3-TM region,His/Glu/Gln/Arg/opine [Planktothrix rubescens NIVA-CYA 18]CAD5972614.1 General L-amino acid transport system permease protein AapM [Planktothrix rubescens NIVA-CYA 18]